MNQKLREFEAKNETLRKESKQMKLETTKLTKAQEKTAAENQLFKRDIQELMRRIDKMEHVNKEKLSQIRLKQVKEVRALEKEMKALESKCVMLETINPTPPFYFTL